MQEKKRPGRPVGTPKTGGRKAGTPNVLSVRAKEALEQAFIGLGGVPALIEFGRQFPQDFYKLWIRVLPAEIALAGPDNQDISIRIGYVDSPEWGNASAPCKQAIDVIEAH